MGVNKISDGKAPISAKRALDDFKRKAAARASKTDRKRLKVGMKASPPSRPAREMAELEAKNEARLKENKRIRHVRKYPEEHEVPLALVSQNPVEHFTEEKKKKIIASILLGLSPLKAAVMAGVTTYTFSQWKTRALAGDNAFLDFFFEIDRAMVQWEAIHLKRIHDAGKDDWRASTWSLERILPQDYMPGSRIEVTGAGGGPIEVKKVAISDILETYADLLDEDYAIIEDAEFTEV